MDTSAPPDIGRFYSDNRNKVFGALRALFERSSVSDEDLADIIQNVFVQLLESEPHASARLNYGFFAVTVNRRVLDFLRKRRCLKRGWKIISSLEKAMEEGFDYPAVDLSPKAEALEIADLVIAAAMPGLGDREIILLRHIRQAAPDSELSLSDLVACLNAGERLRMLPLHHAYQAQDEDALLIKQVSRSRSSLFRRLKRVRDEMEDQGL